MRRRKLGEGLGIQGSKKSKVRDPQAKPAQCISWSPAWRRGKGSGRGNLGAEMRCGWVGHDKGFGLFFSGCSVKPVEDFKPGNASDLNYILVDWMKNG